MLAWIAAQTERIDVGSAVMQIPARTPAMTAMTAATLDTLSGGRFRLGLGVSGPQVSEGWHGVRFDKPLGPHPRVRRDRPDGAAPRDACSYDGEHYTLPLPDGPGKALQADRPSGARARSRSTWPRSGPKNLELAGEIADGWLAIFLSPEHAAELPRPASRAGRAKAGLGRWTASTSSPTVPVCRSATDVAGLRRPGPRRTPRSTSAAWAAGEQNFYNQLARRMGFEAEAAPRSRTSTWTASTGTRPPPCR